MQIPKPHDEHHWLQQLVGDWSYEHVADAGPDQPPMKLTGKQTTRQLGELWIVSEMVGEMPDGGEARSIMTLGYDPAAGNIVGTFISSVMTYLWLYRGRLDASRGVLTLDADGPSFTEEGKMSKYQDIIEVPAKDHHTMRSQMLDASGKWTQFMEAKYWRVV